MKSSRTWKCPECGHIEKIDYDWLAKNGGPICPACDCDCDMKLIPFPQAEVDRLCNRAESAGLEAEDLDNLVHDLASSIASDINNSGMDEQIAYLVGEMGDKAVEKQIDDLIARREKE